MVGLRGASRCSLSRADADRASCRAEQKRSHSEIEDRAEKVKNVANRASRVLALGACACMCYAHGLWALGCRLVAVRWEVQCCEPTDSVRNQGGSDPEVCDGPVCMEWWQRSALRVEVAEAKRDREDVARRPAPRRLQGYTTLARRLMAAKYLVRGRRAKQATSNFVSITTTPVAEKR